MTRNKILNKEKEIMKAIKEIPYPIPFEYNTWVNTKNKIIIKKCSPARRYEIDFYNIPININIGWGEMVGVRGSPEFFKDFRRILVEKIKFILSVIKRPDLFGKLQYFDYPTIADMYKNKKITEDWVRCEKCGHIQLKKGINDKNV